MAAMIGLTTASYICKEVYKVEGASIIIYHDYIGIKHFATGSWKPKKSGAKFYASYIQGFRRENQEIRLKFVKVKAHSGNKWNDAADTIANGIVPEVCKDRMSPVYEF